MNGQAVKAEAAEKADSLCTVQEAADRLTVSTDTVYRLCTSGELPALRIRRAWRIRRTDLETYITGAASAPKGQVA